MSFKSLNENGNMRYKAGELVILNNINGKNFGGRIAKVLCIRDWGAYYVGGRYDYKIDLDEYLCVYEEDIDHIATCQLKNSINKSKSVKITPLYNDEYFYVDLADPNLFGVATWLNDDTDYHMLKLGLIKSTAQECVKMAKDMLKKLDLEV